MNEYIKKIGDIQKFKGKLIEMIDREFEVSKNGKINRVTYEIARRPPGVRLLIIKNNQILLTKEFRSELEDWDYRVAGGKIFENLNDYLKYVDNEELIKEKAIETVKDEGIEEAGIIVHGQELYYKSTSGSAMEWDLYYFVIKDFETAEKGNQTESAEIIYPEWFTFEEAKEMCLNGSIKEDRTIGVLLKYILSHKV